MAIRADQVEIKERLGTLEAQYSSISRPIDRIVGDIERIKTGLELHDEPAG